MLTQRAVVLLACVWTLSSCAPRRAEPPSPPTVPEAPVAKAPAGAQMLEIDPERSAVTILVRRAGPLARLGHNHVIMSAQESGRAWLANDLAESGFEIRLPVSAFVVDDPTARSAAGSEFAGEVPAQAREDTYRNMLRAEVLDGERFPSIVVQARRISGSWERPVALALVTLRGATHEVEIPIDLERDPETLTARGFLRIRQSDFGMVPFSVGGGAIQVADDLDIGFEIVATVP